MNDHPHAGTLRAAFRHDLAGIRAQLDLLADDELIVLRSALWDVAVELRFTLTDRGYDMNALPRCDLSRDQWWSVARRCLAPGCARTPTPTRARYCSDRCQTRAELDLLHVDDVDEHAPRRYAGTD